MKKLAILLAMVLCLASLVSFTGCMDAADTMFADDAKAGNAAPESNNVLADSDRLDTITTTSGYPVSGSEDKDGYHINSDDNGDDDVAGATAQEFERKVIRNASLVLEVVEPEDTENEGDSQAASQLYALIVERCNQLGGHEFSNNMTQHEGHSNVRTTVHGVLKVPPEKLDEFLKFVGDSARIKASKSNSEDVTANYYDLQTRLETKRKSLESYYKLLENADNLDDVVSLQRTIDSIIEDIEATEGKLKVMESMTRMATVTLEIHQVLEFEEIEERREVDWGALSADDMGYLIRNGFRAVVNFIAGLFQWIIIAVAVTSPLWIPVAIVIVVLVTLSKKKRKARLAEIAQKEKEYKANKAKEGKSDESDK